jgi:hypothetical protein
MKGFARLNDLARCVVLSRRQRRGTGPWRVGKFKMAMPKGNRKIRETNKTQGVIAVLFMLRPVLVSRRSTNTFELVASDGPESVVGDWGVLARLSRRRNKNNLLRRFDARCAALPNVILKEASGSNIVSEPACCWCQHVAHLRSLSSSKLRSVLKYPGPPEGVTLQRTNEAWFLTPSVTP